MRTAVLQDLLTVDGPFASVFFDGSHDTEDAAKEVDLRWRAVREQLTEAREPTLRALDDAISSGPPAVGRAGRFMIAAGDAVLIDEYLPAVPAHPVARVSALPYIVPLATEAPRRVPHVVVMVDKLGADLRAVDGDGAVVAEYSVEGREKPVHKVGEGGWGHRRIQQHAEETVKHNISDVAAETARLGQQTGAHLIVLVGDVGPRTLLRRALPPGHAQITAEVDVSRQADKSIVDKEVAELVARRWQAEHDEVLDRFRAELNRDNGRAVQGLGPTAEALREANVAALVISDPTMGDQTVWTGSAPQLVALEPGELEVFGSSQRISGRADEALPVAAVAVGAELMAGDVRLGDGVGALLRHG